MTSVLENNNTAPKSASSVPAEKSIRTSEIESLCLCPVCYSSFNDNSKLARMLHCGHTFCTECILNVQKFAKAAFVECPSCRAQTKCLVNKISPNYIVMELIQKFGLLGPSAASAPSLETISRDADPAKKTVREMADTCYRQMISHVETELQHAFTLKTEELADESSSYAQEVFDDLCESVERAVREACSGELEEVDTSSERSDNDDDRRRHVTFDNPLNLSDDSDDEESDTEETDSSEESGSSDESSGSGWSSSESRD